MEIIIKYITTTSLILSVACWLFILLRSTWRKIRFFISYNNEMQLYVTEIVRVLSTGVFECLYIPFRPDGHDSVISNTSQTIRKCDVVLVFPGSRTNVNFTDAEVFAAVAMNKYVIMLKLKGVEQHLPNTAYTTLIRINYEFCKRQEFKPIRRLSKVVTKHVSFGLKALIFGTLACVPLFVLFSLTGSLSFLEVFSLMYGFVCTVITWYWVKVRRFLFKIQSGMASQKEWEANEFWIMLLLGGWRYEESLFSFGEKVIAEEEFIKKY